ncbi:hypothetical protein E2P81_ATG05047 [Venturia nashicola]|uniref:Cell wall mannoprotein PIR1-like C-terminal domain-containing protein n=1 Tax=Venturia nashicola TaxID=86259 RepID=A0A4Z1NZX8_9PEZI|nr:hypothetical protein E6O75_ATG05173 [Venturia nashicola]TLD34882.1 hypothetical protein E2P81_ATG05047 [Venturia nashicola]
MKRHAILFALVAAAIASPLVDPPPAKPQGGGPPAKPKGSGPPTAAPSPQRGIGTGVTEKIAPPGPPPPKCIIAYSGKFGIAVQNITAQKMNVIPAAAPAILPVATAAKPAMSPAETTPPPPAVGLDSPPPDQPNQDGANTTQTTRTFTRTVTVRRTVVGQEMKQSVYMISQIGDGQIQAPTAPTVLQRTTFAGPAVPAAATPGSPKTIDAGSVVGEIGDGQVQAPVAPSPAVATPAAAPPAGAPLAAVPPMADMSGMNMRRDVGAPPDAPATQLVSCITKGTLNITLDGGVMKDDKGRTAYIASNYQLQFDDPPQSGSIFTAGFSVCNNGSLALGGSTTWYQCRSGDFYNLYDRWWAEQCNPVTINAVMLKQC